MDLEPRLQRALDRVELVGGGIGDPGDGSLDLVGPGDVDPHRQCAATGLGDRVDGLGTGRLVEVQHGDGVAGVVLDFAIAMRDVAAQSDEFPAELVRLSGACGVALALSRYAVSRDDARQAKYA